MGLVNVPGLQESDGIVFKTIPTGEYHVRITGVMDKLSREKSSPMLEIACRVIEGEHTDYSLKTWIMLPTEDMSKTESQRCVAKLKRLIVACGLQATEDNFDTQDLYGGEFKAVINEERKDGKDPMNNIRDFLPL